MTPMKLVSPGSLLIASVLVVSALTPGRALAWELFRSENDHVADGNELLRAGDHAGALREYDLAARELPSEPGVHLDRGLALMAAGDFGRAREAFTMAADPPATAEIRAMAHYNIGLTYYREGDALASGTPVPGAAPAAPANPLGGLFGGGATPPTAPGAPGPADHDGARRAFREAADAFRDSLRQVPGNRDAGWNLELALRRITEEDEAEERENEENEASEDGEESEESSEGGEEGEDESEGGDEGEDESEGGEEGEDESEGEPGDEGEEPGEAGDETGEDGADDGSEESEESGRESGGDPSSDGGDGSDGSEDGEGSETEAGGTNDRSLSPDAERVLDALENSEENLAAARARGRGEHASRRVERDW